MLEDEGSHVGVEEGTCCFDMKAHHMTPLVVYNITGN